MSFQAYLDTIKAKTGKVPADFKKELSQKGILKSDMKAAVLVSFLAKEYGLGHGHSMAIWAVFKDKGWVNTPKK